MKIFNCFNKRNFTKNSSFTISLIPSEPNESVDNLVKSEKLSNNLWKNNFKFYICSNNIILNRNNNKKILSLKKFMNIIEAENYAKNFNATIFFNVVGKSFYNRLNFFYSFLISTDKTDNFECITINDQGLSFWCLKSNKNIHKILSESGNSPEKLISVHMVLTKK